VSIACPHNDWYFYRLNKIIYKIYVDKKIKNNGLNYFILYIKKILKLKSTLF